MFDRHQIYVRIKDKSRKVKGLVHDSNRGREGFNKEDAIIINNSGM
jgi:hypothetical protein